MFHLGTPISVRYIETGRFGVTDGKLEIKSRVARPVDSVTKPVTDDPVNLPPPHPETSVITHLGTSEWGRPVCQPPSRSQGLEGLFFFSLTILWSDPNYVALMRNSRLILAHWQTPPSESIGVAPATFKLFPTPTFGV